MQNYLFKYLNSISSKNSFTPSLPYIATQLPLSDHLFSYINKLHNIHYLFYDKINDEDTNEQNYNIFTTLSWQREQNRRSKVTRFEKI